MKRFTILTLSSILLFTAGCSQQTEQTPTLSSDNTNPLCNVDNGMAGGWVTSSVTPDVKAALDHVLSMMNTSAKLKQILDVKTQMVNGINYAIDFELDDGQIWNTKVFRSLKGKFKMTQPAQHGSFSQDCQ
ncbi:MULTISPECIES: cystatin domain-containing protein [unclassified Aliivibrio]|uniref:cystatin domain-containing protein n=1 Tax=unclassified Aliivibrio TaxID=2645654 RepID=UPI00080DA52B|nr:MULTISPECIES: cystatin domain-containing protein [unclassified Aliivibrio]OCH15523.1 2-oxoglutarate dehydrogenase [Aliivibrio sp. 1S128]OCH18115.1 2-oxoglutarate dehydrogenase [Aliivibrio sp. 1S165]OCH35492.1 2-oxoglutarate dehydrogenase [Aliivibrio sp. 1S175]